MKKTFKNIRTLAALLIASAAFTACSNEDGAVIGEQPAQQQAPQVFTLTLQAGKTDGAGTRALALDGTKLVAKWEAGDELTVINVTSGTPLGTMTASNVSADGQTCTFSGTLTGTIEVNNQLTLLYHIPATGTQVGTLASAAANDQAHSNVTVASVDAGNITIKESKATFTTTTAVLKLTLKDGSTNALNATSLTMTVDGVDIFTASPTAATYTVNGDGVLYFAVPRQIDAAEKIVLEKTNGHPTEELVNTWTTNLNTYDVTFTATVGSNTYTATKTGYKLAAGKYYATQLTMAKAATSLSELKTAINGGTDCSSYIGWEVNSAGAIAESGVSGTKIGYVAYVSTSDVDADVSGSRILVIASADAAATTLTWGSKGTARSVEAVENANDLNGYSNTNTLQGYGSGAHPAAYAAWNYSATIPSGGASPAHWFMPTKKQWENMRDAKGGTYSAMATAYGIDGHYWTSNEYFNGTDYSECANYAWRFVTNSDFSSIMKSLDIKVRSIFAY